MGYKRFEKTAIPLKKNFAVFDIETKGWDRPYCIGFYNGRLFKLFLGNDCIYDFLRFSITHKFRAYNIYAHNGGKFDFNFLADWLKESDRRLEFLFRGSTCVKLTVYHSNKTDEEGNYVNRNNTRFVDSYTLLPYSLDRLTRDFNVQHAKTNFTENGERDYEVLYRLYKQNDPKFFAYVQHDCMGLYEVLDKFYDLIHQQNGCVGLTLASTSLKTFKNGFLDKELKMTSRELNDEMRQGYYGGRVEIFSLFQDNGNYFCFDVNSLYPFVMRNNKYPISPPHVVKNPSKDHYLKYEGFTECNVNVPYDLYLPVLPYRLDKKLFFPVGKLHGIWDNILLQKAYEKGCKIYPLKGYVFKTDYLFKDYVDRFYSLKKHSVPNTAPYIIAKLLLNSLYGKFAQRQESESIVKILDPSNTEYEIKDVLDPDFNLFRVKTESSGNHFLPQISMHVTACSMLVLYEYMEKILESGHNIAYCDTDSVFTDHRLRQSERLGGMKLEYTYKRGYFLLPKTYYVCDGNGFKKVKAKGFIYEFQDKLTESSFKKALFYNDYSDFVMESDISLNSMKQSFRRHGGFVSTDVRRKSIKSQYDKRKINKDYTTRPFSVKELLSMR